MKTSELTGISLDWAVAKCEGLTQENGWTDLELFNSARCGGFYHYSTDWELGGPILERERVHLMACIDKSNWIAEIDHPVTVIHGTTPLQAAMRCYVASKLGGEVNLPKELLNIA